MLNNHKNGSQIRIKISWSNFKMKCKIVLILLKKKKQNIYRDKDQMLFQDILHMKMI